MASDWIEEMTRSVHASVGRSSGMSQGDLTIDGSQPIRLAVSSARPGSKSLIVDVRWLRVDRGSKGREFARPSSQRRESQRLAQDEFGKRGFRNRHGSDEMRGLLRVPSARDPIRHATSDNPRGVDGNG